MITTTNDLVERLKLLDEVTLIELLDLRSEEIVDRFSDVILDRFDEIAGQLDDDDEEEENPWFWER